jgi:uncharacterized protein YndB with AHSA1/START domain
VFRFLIDPALLRRWLGRAVTLQPWPGGTFRVELSRGNVARGVFTEVTPARRVAFTWGWEAGDPALAALAPGASLVEIDLQPERDGTRLRLRHSGLPEDLSARHEDRWSYYLGRLEATTDKRRHTYDTAP